METVTIILVLLVAVAVSSFLARAARSILPVPLIQITLGAAISCAFDFQISLPPDIFFLLFLAPLLFLDGWRIPREGLFRDKWAIAALAFGLVVFTVLGAGFFIHWLIPAMPLAVAFALAAILSPTDAVAVSAIAGRLPIPKRLFYILQGESLLNDASGLVCMRFAIAAAASGTFSLAAASAVFLWLVIGGVATGVLVAVLINAVKDWTASHFGEETGTQILVSLLIPFGAYILADRLGASGILAAVAAGVTMNHEERSGRASAITRIRRAAVWDAVQFAGNGVIFVLLGHQLSGIVAGAGLAIRQSGRANELWLLVYIIGVSCVLAILRSLWAWVTLSLIQFRSTPRRPRIDMAGWRQIALTSLAGVRGAVTLSGVMTFPLVLQDGSAFPARDLAILLAAGVIVVTLLAANIGLPYLMRGNRLPQERPERREEDNTRLAMARAAITAVERALAEADKGDKDANLHAQVGASVLAYYRQQIDTYQGNAEDCGRVGMVVEAERKLRLIALRAERDELYRISHIGRLTDELTRSLVREVDLQESRFSAR